MNWNNVSEITSLPEGAVIVPVVGVSFISGYPDNLHQIHKNISDTPTIVTIRRNPANKYDGNACEVLVDGDMIGHVSRELAAQIAPEIDTGIGFKGYVYRVRINPDSPNNPGIDVLLHRIEQRDYAPGERV